MIKRRTPLLHQHYWCAGSIPMMVWLLCSFFSRQAKNPVSKSENNDTLQRSMFAATFISAVICLIRQSVFCRKWQEQHHVTGVVWARHHPRCLQTNSTRSRRLVSTTPRSSVRSYSYCRSVSWPISITDNRHTDDSMYAKTEWYQSYRSMWMNSIRVCMSHVMREKDSMRRWSCLNRRAPCCDGISCDELMVKVLERQTPTVRLFSFSRLHHCICQAIYSRENTTSNADPASRVVPHHHDFRGLSFTKYVHTLCDFCPCRPLKDERSVHFLGGCWYARKKEFHPLAMISQHVFSVWCSLLWWTAAIQACCSVSVCLCWHWVVVRGRTKELPFLVQKLHQYYHTSVLLRLLDFFVVYASYNMYRIHGIHFNIVYPTIELDTHTLKW